MRIKLLVLLIFMGAISGCVDSMQASSSKSMVIGAITAEQLLAEYDHFSHQYRELGQIDLSSTEVETLRNMKFIVLFGSWCHDSVREVPYFIRLMEAADITDYQLVGVDYSKQDDKGLATFYELKSTPTFVVLDAEGVEIGRFVESSPYEMEDVFLSFSD
ncbi:thioredoxin family protein [uncultured Umboniibacter sp.]|uniref:TlpA family protein disulfide reductase n=1 Tax=uncultured Umboniibacter sp. TaxID=1798917 RepID=UPI00261E54FC|nr:thioredoxin family protein [uncultured Umboniibacter sp.]